LKTTKKLTNVNNNKPEIAMDNFQQKLRTGTIDVAVTELLRSKEGNDGRLPQGTMVKVLSELREAGIKTDRDHLNYLMTKKIKAQKKEIDKLNQLNNNKPTDEIEIDNEDEEPDLSTLTRSALSESAGKRGRRVGTSLTSMMESKRNKVECINEITKIFATEQKANINSNKKNI
jgi:hypothetical protein